MDIRFDILTEDVTTLVQQAPVHLNVLDSKIRQLANSLKRESPSKKQGSIKADLLNLDKATLEKLVRKCSGSFDSPFNLFYFLLLSLTSLRKNKEISSKKWLESIELLQDRLKCSKEENRPLVFSFFLSLVEEKLLEMQDCENLLTSLLKAEEAIPTEILAEELKAAIKTLVSSKDKKALTLLEKILLALDHKEAAFIPLFAERLSLLEYAEYQEAEDSIIELLKEYKIPSSERERLTDKERLLFLDVLKRHDLQMLKTLLEEGLSVDKLYKGRKEPLFVEIYDKRLLTPQALSLFLEFGLDPAMHLAQDSTQTFWKYCIDQKKTALIEVLLLHEASLGTKVHVTKVVNFTPYIETLSLFEYALLTGSYEVAALFATHLRAETLSEDPGVLDFIISLLEEEKEEKDQVYLQVIVDALSVHMR